MRFYDIETSVVGFMGLGTTELMIFAAVLLILFGGAKLPSLMRNMGRSVNEFKAGIKEKPKYDPLDDEADESPRKVAGRSKSKEEEDYSETK